MFIPRDVPLKSCSHKDCNECSVKSRVNCHFSLKQLIHFACLSLPSFLIGAAGLYESSVWWLVVWVLIVIGYFGFLEIKVMCSHCPHYAEDSKSLKCWANYGVPKLWKYNPGPMSTIEKALFLSGLTLVWGLPFIVMIFTGQIFYLIVFVLATAGFFITLRKDFCSVCMNFACPLNQVSERDREEFFSKNPDLSEAWGIKVNFKNKDIPQ